MAIIATLVKQSSGEITGTLTTLTVCTNITFKPEKSDNEKAPAYRVFASGETVNLEIGAGWKKTSKAGKPYISVKLDDPGFAQPVYCVLIKAEDRYTLEWTRQTPRRSKDNGTTEMREF